jgi:hypothetical protein
VSITHRQARRKLGSRSVRRMGTKGSGAIRGQSGSKVRKARPSIAVWALVRGAQQVVEAPRTPDHVFVGR